MCKSKFGKTVLLASAFLLLSSGAMAQKRCSQRDEIIGLLADKYKEAPIAVGITSSGELLEVLTSGDGTTWTIIYSTPDGRSCLIAAGEGWHDVEFDLSIADPQV